MKPFEYARVNSVAQAAEKLGSKRDEAKILAGGTDLLGEMKNYIVTPSLLVNIKTIPNLDKIEWDSKTGLKLGALVTLSRIAEDKTIASRYAALTEAIDSAAMPQIRNAATIAGNLCQRPRCWYYRDETIHCLKKGGSKCYAKNGENQYHAIFGGGPCYIVHPSDPANALMALDASVIISNGKSERTVSLDEFFVLPSDDPYRENILKQNEVITHVVIPPPPSSGLRSAYVKEKEKDSFDWAISAAAVALTLDGAKKVQTAKIVLGGVAPIPWRAKQAEAVLKGQMLTANTMNAAAQAAVAGAELLEKNAYKVPLTAVITRRALERAVA